MAKYLFTLSTALIIAGCSSTSPELPEDNVRFVLGGPLSSYDVQLSIGNFKDGGFKEGSFSKPSYVLTGDKRYIVGNAKRGSVIAITSAIATDASGNYLGKFTPCNKTLVFQLPTSESAVYVTDISYDWNNVVIYPQYKDNYGQAKQYFETNSEFGIGDLSQASYHQLYAKLYSGCRQSSSHPYALWRPY